MTKAKKPQTVSQTLLAALQILDDPSRWTKKVLARNAQDEPAYPQDPAACKFCMLGAIGLAAGGAMVSDAKDLVRKTLKDNQMRGFIAKFNDDHFTTHDQVLQVMTASAFYALAQEQPAHP